MTDSDQLSPGKQLSSILAYAEGLGRLVDPLVRVELLDAADADVLRDFIASHVDEFVDVQARVLEQFYTDEELTGLVQFFTSVLGAAWLKRKIEVICALQAAAQEVFTERLDELGAALVAREAHDARQKVSTGCDSSGGHASVVEGARV